jgi:hypothetical protein
MSNQSKHRGRKIATAGELNLELVHIFSTTVDLNTNQWQAN